MEKMQLWPLALAVLVAPSVACEESGRAERQKETQAASQVASSQAAANRDIVNAQEEFAKTRENYLHSRRIDIINLDEKVFDLETKEQTATGKTRVNLSTHLPDIRTRRQDFAHALEAMSNESAANWDAAKTSLDKQWDRLKASVDQAE